MPKNKKTISDAVREVCLSFPEAEEGSAHGAPHFKVRGKTFAMYTINHHGDGRISLWLNSPPGAQEMSDSIRLGCYAVSLDGEDVFVDV